MKKNRSKTQIGSDPHKIVINKSQFEDALQTSSNFQIAFLEYFKDISFHYPSNKLWNFLKNTEFLISCIITSRPIPQFSSVQSLVVSDSFLPMSRSTPGLLVHHHLPEFTQTHVHRVSDAISSSVVPFSSCPQSPPASESFPMSQLFA